MADPSTLREALLADALGEVGELLRRIEEVSPRVNDAIEALTLTDSRLRASLVAYEKRMAVITENAKTRTLQHLADRTNEATRLTIDQQTRAMADAARLALGTEIGGTIQRLQTVLKPLLEQAERSWERWLIYFAVACVSSSITWGVTFIVLAR
jgi:hypothetical protein